MFEKIELTPAATSAQTHTSKRVEGYEALAFEANIVAASGTPALSWKIQGTLDGDDISDANAHWFDVLYVTPTSDTASAAVQSFTTPAAGESEIIWLANPTVRKYRRFRAVTSVVTTTTYRINAYRTN